MVSSASNTEIVSADGAALKLLGFMKGLRGAGFQIGVAESRDALSLALDEGGFDRRDFRTSLRHLLCSNREQWQRFNGHFTAFYGGVTQQGKHEDDGLEELDDDADDKFTPQFTIVADFYQGEEGCTEGGAGHNASVTRADFRFLTDKEAYEEAARLTEQMARSIKTRPSRRWRRKNSGKRIDLASTLRHLAATDGDPLKIGRKERKRRPLHVVALLDVSHSMSYYSPMLARFVRGLVHNFKDCEAFCFHMELHRITDHLKEPDLELMRARMEAMENIWFGGTNISASLNSFNERYLDEVTTRNTVVLLFTDGCDTCSEKEMLYPIRRLRSKVRKLYWINPMRARLHSAGLSSTSPLKGALGFIDAEISGDSYRSLEELVRVLSR